MKRYFLKKFRMLVSIGMILSVATPLHAVVFWDNTMAPNVDDDNLVINGAVQLNAGGTHISSVTNDIVVSLLSSSVVRGNDTAPSQLYVTAGAGRTVRFYLQQYDLSFIGSTDANKTPLLIVVSGPGNVEFQLRGGRSISFTSTATSGGVQVYQLMSSGTHNTISFYRDNAFFAEENVSINVGPQSLISYLAGDRISLNPTSVGSIVFNPVSTDPVGRMILNIEDTGAYLIKGVYTNSTNPLGITLANIDRTIAAGLNAVTSVINSLGSTNQSGLLITSSNKTFFELLVDPFGFQGAQLDPMNYKGSFNGVQYSFLLGANGQLVVDPNAYVDYVGLSDNICPVMPSNDCFTIDTIKSRNPSAFFIDGNLNPQSTPALLSIAADAAIFFRSGVNCVGTIENDANSENPFVVTSLSGGAGDYVLDVEGIFDVVGQNDGDLMQSKIEILSLQVSTTVGAPLFVGGTQTNFPGRTFATDCGALLRYNKAAFLINNVMNLHNVSLSHTDENHLVVEKNDVCSEPTYVGGELSTLDCSFSRPRITFTNARFLLNTSVAVTGVDLVVPNDSNGSGICTNNISKFVFYYNGNAIDRGTGRQLNLGTLSGSQACDGCTIISADAHLDIIQTSTCDNAASGIQDTLILTVAPNDNTINHCITGDITNQCSLNTIYLGHSSNISIGLDPLLFDPLITGTITPTLEIAGNFFSFATRGGPNACPAVGGLTGKGIIFIDCTGKIVIDSQYRAIFGTMIVKRGDAQVILPKQQIYFEDLVGITDWHLDLSTTPTIIPVNQTLADFTLNWRAACKDYDVFNPYIIKSVNTCGCPPVQQDNISGIPVVAGEVDQLQVQGSRLGDQATLMIDGGWVRELLFQKGSCSGEAPVAYVVLKNDGRVGLNTAHTNPDSLLASDTLGVNGITIIADGNGQVDLNEDMVINNVCSILKGPNFVEGNVLTINADTEKALRVKPTGVLDLRSFSEGDIVRFAGQVKVILEPGARILLDGVFVEFFDATTLECEPLIKSELLFSEIPVGPIDNALPVTSTPAEDPHNEFAPLTNFGAGVQNTDPFRVRLIGTGALRFADSSGFYVPLDTFVGVETLFQEIQVDSTTTETCEIPVTNLIVILNDDANFVIGDPNSLGGAFQVGNTQDYAGHSVNFTLNPNGSDTQFIVKSNGFVGFGVGIVDKRSLIPSEWYVDTLFNVGQISIINNDGLISHTRTFDSDKSNNDLSSNDSNAALIAFADYGDGTPTYFLLLEDQDTHAGRRLGNSDLHGGGNIILLRPSADALEIGAIAPIVRSDDGIPTGSSGRYFASILSSRIMMENLPAIGESFIPSDLYNFIKIKDYFTAPGAARGKGTASLSQDEFDLEHEAVRVGYLDRGQIGRQDIYDISEPAGGTQQQRREKADDIGAISIQCDRTQAPPAPISFAQQILD